MHPVFVPAQGHAGKGLEVWVLEFGTALVMAKGRGPLVDLIIIGDQKAALPAGQGFARHDGHGPHVADGAQEPALVPGPLGVGDILDHLEPPPLGDLHDRVHVGGIAAVVDGDDGLGARGDPPLYVGRVQGEGEGMGLAENHGPPQGENL